MEKELNLDLINVANRHSAQNQIKEDELERRQAWEDVKKTLATLEIKELQDAFYRKSLQDTQNSKRKQIFGKTYVGKKITKNIVIVVSITVICLITGSTINALFEVSNYNTVLDQKIEKELTEEERKAYQSDHSNPISTALDAYLKIHDAKNTLDSSNYDFQGQNITDTDNEYIPFNEGIGNTSERTQDAINLATDKVIEEYKGRSGK